MPPSAGNPQCRTACGARPERRQIMSASYRPREIVLVGGGHLHAELLDRFSRKRSDRFNVTLHRPSLDESLHDVDPGSRGLPRMNGFEDRTPVEHGGGVG